MLMIWCNNQLIITIKSNIFFISLKIKQVTNKTNIKNKTNILQKYSKYLKLISINQFVNKQNHILKTCNLCCQQYLIYYKESTDYDKKKILLPKIMVKDFLMELI